MKISMQTKHKAFEITQVAQLVLSHDWNSTRTRCSFFGCISFFDNDVYQFAGNNDSHIAFQCRNYMCARDIDCSWNGR